MVSPGAPHPSPAPPATPLATPLVAMLGFETKRNEQNTGIRDEVSEGSKRLYES